MIYSEFANIKNMHRVFFLEFYNCHRIYAQKYVSDKKYYINPEYKIIYILEGSLILEDKGITHKLKKGSMYAIRPNTYHRTYSDGGSEPIFIGFELNLDCLVKRYKFEPDYLYSGMINDKRTIDKLSHIFRILLKARLSSSYSDYEVINNLIELIDYLKVDIKIKDREDNLNSTEKLIVNITKKLPDKIKNGDDLRLKTLAEEEGISYYYLSKKFKEFIGLSYRDYLLENQMLVFVNSMIQNMDANIADLAYQSGYRSLSSFNKDFKKFFDITPSELIDAYLEILKFKKKAYTHPTIIGFLNNTNYMSKSKINEDLVLDFTGMCRILSYKESSKSLDNMYKTIIKKLKSSKDITLSIFYGYTDYIFFLNDCSGEIKEKFISMLTELLIICQRNNIKIFMKIN